MYASLPDPPSACEGLALRLDMIVYLGLEALNYYYQSKHRDCLHCLADSDGQQVCKLGDEVRCHRHIEA